MQEKEYCKPLKTLRYVVALWPALLTSGIHRRAHGTEGSFLFALGLAKNLIGRIIHMKNLKISLKLLIGFGLILAMFVACVTFASFSLRSVSNDLDEFYRRPFANMARAIEADMDSEVAAKYMLRACMEEGTAETEEMLNNVTKYMKNMKSTLTELKNNYSGNTEDIVAVENLINRLEESYNKYAAAARRNDITGAYQIYKAEIVDLLTDITDAVATVKEQASNYAQKSHDNGMASSNTTISVMIVVGVVAVLIGIVMAVYITKNITTTVKELKNASKRMSEGDFESQIKYHSKDELGELAESTRVMLATMRSVIHDIGYMMNELAVGNLTVRSEVPESYVGQLHPILEAINKMKADLNMTMDQIANASVQVNSGADQVSSAAQALAQGATEQAASVEELAATISSIAEQIESTAEHAKQAEIDNRHAGEEIGVCAEHMNELMTAMQVINEKSKEISKVVKTIEDIAFQTNILALNAAVEAARAGTAGKGFAVVADEVRNLATKSQEAAGSTTILIEETVKAVQNGFQLSSETDESLKKVVVDSEKVLESVALISSATADQSAAATQITLGIDQISSVVQTNSATAEQSAAASEELSSQATLLKEQISVFTLDTGM